MATKWIAQEQITVDDTAAGVAITTSKYVPTADDNKNVFIAEFHLKSGGPIYHTDRTDSDNPSVTGANGEHYETVGSKWRITGSYNIADWRGIREGATSGVIQVNLYGAD